MTTGYFELIDRVVTIHGSDVVNGELYFLCNDCNNSCIVLIKSDYIILGF